MESATNTFTSGMNLDLAPLTTPNTVLTYCLNGTMVTFNGNEQILQNDMGNCKVGAELPVGYVPVGMKEHGGVIYVASYNPQSNMSQIGSFPSPSRNLEDTSNNKVSYDLPTVPGTFTQTAITTSKILSGDSLYIKIPNLNSTEFTPTFKDGSGTLYDELNRRYSIYITVMGPDGTLVDQTANFKPILYGSEYYWFGLDATQDPIYTIYNGISGIPYLKIVYNGIIDQDLDVLLTKSISSLGLLNLQINADYLFNSPYNNNGFKGVKVKYRIDNNNWTEEYININTEATKASDAYTLHLKGVITGINPNNGTYLEYEITPYYQYDGDIIKIDNWTVKGKAQIDLISSGISKINTWKYRYESAKDIYITWGMESYPSGINGQDVPKNIIFKFYSLENLNSCELASISAINALTYNTKNVYFLENEPSVPNGETEGMTVQRSEILSKVIKSEPSVEYVPEIRSNYNGIFNENLTDLNFLEGKCYLVAIHYTINDGIKDIENIYYKWLITTDLYNSEYYGSQNDFNMLTPKVEIPNIQVGVKTSYVQESAICTVGDINLRLDNPGTEEMQATVESVYSYQLYPEYTIQQNSKYPVKINASKNIGLKLDSKLCSQYIKDTDGVDFNNNKLTYTYKTNYTYKYQPKSISVVNYFQTYGARQFSALPITHEIVIWAYSYNQGDYNRFECYFDMYDMKGNTIMHQVRFHEKQPHGYVAIDEDDASVNWKLVDMDLQIIYDRLTQSNMGLMALVIMPAILTDNVNNPEQHWYGTQGTDRHVFSDLSYNFIVKTEGDPMLLNENFILTNNERDVENYSFVAESDLYLDILTSNKQYTNITNYDQLLYNKKDTYTYIPSNFPVNIKVNPYMDNGLFKDIAVCTGTSVINGYLPEQVSASVNDSNITEQLPIVLNPNIEDFTLTIPNVDSTKWNNVINNLCSDVAKFFNFKFGENTQIKFDVVGLPQQFDHVKFGTSKIALISGNTTLQSLIKYENTFIQPDGDLSSSQILRCKSDGTYNAINSLVRAKVDNEYHAIFGESSNTISRLIGIADRYRVKKTFGHGKHTGTLFRFPAGFTVANADDVVKEINSN